MQRSPASSGGIPSCSPRQTRPPIPPNPFLTSPADSSASPMKPSSTAHLSPPAPRQERSGGGGRARRAGVLTEMAQLVTAPSVAEEAVFWNLLPYSRRLSEARITRGNEVFRISRPGASLPYLLPSGPTHPLQEVGGGTEGSALRPPASPGVSASLSPEAEKDGACAPPRICVP